MKAPFISYTPPATHYTGLKLCACVNECIPRRCAILHKSITLLFLLLFLQNSNVQSQGYSLVRTPSNMGSEHPYRAGWPGYETCVWREYIAAPTAGGEYLCVHFDTVDLALGDKLIVRTPDGRSSWTYDHQVNSKRHFTVFPFMTTPW